MNAERIHQVEQLDLLFDGRVNHRRRLQAIAQRLVVQFDATRRRVFAPDGVPIINQLVSIHTAASLED